MAQEDAEVRLVEPVARRNGGDMPELAKIIAILGGDIAPVANAEGQNQERDKRHDER